MQTESSADANDAPGSDRRETVLGWALAAVVTLITVLTRYPWVDDAYITFRFSENLRQFGEYTYNRGEHVLGTTAPLWGLLLALTRSLGISYESASLAFGVAAFASLPFVTSRLWKRLLCPSDVALLCAILLFFPLNHMTATSGMESGVYILVTIAALLADRARRGVWAGILGAVAFGLRPDGALVPAAVFFVRIWREPRYAFTVVLTWTVAVTPWLVWATYYYGSPVPHSIVAKRLIHPSTFEESARALLERLTRSDLEIALNLLGIAGLLAWLRKPDGRVFVTWIVLYMLGLMASGVDPLFYWYAAPWWTWVVLFGAPAALDFVTSKMSAGKVRSLVPSVLIVLVVLTVIQAVAVRKIASERFESIHMYRDALPVIRGRFRDGDSMYLCETGYIGYELLFAYIYDSAGINSPQVLDLVTSQNGAPRKPIERHILAMQRFMPVWIVSLRDICSIREAEAAGWFRDAYELFLETPSQVSGGLVVFRRKGDVAEK
jgi:hypothetical protein